MQFVGCEGLFGSMQDTRHIYDEDLTGLSKKDWLTKLESLTEEHGYFSELGRKHYASFVENSTTLFVTFENLQGIQVLSDDAHPIGWDMIRVANWSHLAMISDGDTWFRDEHVYAYFDRMVDDGFFDEFEQVIFYGAGPCGYAAAAFSVVAPGSTVLTVQPQATLDPAIAGWDERFAEERRRDFTSRYGYAPDMMDAAGQGFVIYDPCVTLDAMHAALFTAPNVTKLPVRHLGATIQTQLMDMQALYKTIALASVGRLNRESFAKLMRARRDHPPYLRNLLARLDADDRSGLARMLCANVSRRLNAPKFARRLRELESGGVDAAE